MSNDVNLKTFPGNRTEALTMLYLEKQDLAGKTPKEITELYFDTFVAIKDAIWDIRKQNR